MVKNNEQKCTTDDLVKATQNTYTNSKKNNILFRSALGYWNRALNDLFDKKYDNFSFQIVEWDKNEVNSFDPSRVVLDKDSASIPKLRRYKEFSTNDYLYIFIAPMTWAARFIQEDFIILGPAFGTNNSISIFANKQTPYNYERDEIRIGTIGHYITSTALLRVYHLFMTRIFHTNIHLLCHDNVCSYEKHDSAMPKFRFPPKPNAEQRYLDLVRHQQGIDFAIFTAEDINSLNLRSKNDIREILKIDPLITHVFNLDFVPRTVYCIHKSQLNMIKAIENFNQMINDQSKKFNKPMIIGNESQKIVIFPANPNDEEARKVQKSIIQKYRIIEDSIDIEELKFTNIDDIIYGKNRLMNYKY